MPYTPLIELVSHRPGAPRAYRVAGARLVTDVHLPAMQPFGEEGAAAWLEEWDAPGPDGGRRVFAGLGLIGDGMRQVVCHESAAGYRLAVDGIGTYWIAPDGRRVTEVEIDTDCAVELRAMTTLGAPLILALALQEIFCIHASVVAFGDQLIAFVGESGAGKSTLARYLAESENERWRRVIDDTLPVKLIDGSTVTARPHFPQLKMPDVLQPVHLAPAEIPLSVVYSLAKTERDECAQIESLGYRQSALTLVQHTVAGRLFGPDLLAKHFSFCAEAAARVPVKRLTYPHSYDRLPHVRDELNDDLCR